MSRSNHRGYQNLGEMISIASLYGFLKATCWGRLFEVGPVGRWVESHGYLEISAGRNGG